MDTIKEIEKLAELKSKGIISDEEFEKEKRKILEQDSSKDNKNKTFAFWIKIFLGICFVSCIYNYSRGTNQTSTNTNYNFRADNMAKDIEIIQQYDCPEGYYHRVCGILKNNISRSISGEVNVYYYDKNDIKVCNSIAIFDVEPQGKTKFSTTGCTEQFAYYKIKIEKFPFPL